MHPRLPEVCVLSECPAGVMSLVTLSFTDRPPFYVSLCLTSALSYLFSWAHLPNNFLSSLSWGFF